MRRLFHSPPPIRDGGIDARRPVGLSVGKTPTMSPLRLLSLSGLACCLLASWPQAAAAVEKPNIIYILADDQGYGDVSALNPESKIPTPHIDRLATGGMIFTDAHSSSGVCTPTRYSLLTGRYHWRTRLQNGVLGGFSAPLIAPDRVTVADFLKEHGYQTACIGKWHLGFDWPLKGGGVADDRGEFGQAFADGWRVDYAGAIQNGPLDAGFDRFFGISASLDMPPYVYIRDRVPTELATVVKAFFRKGPAGAGFEAVDVLPALATETVAEIGARAAGAREGKPFFIYLPLNGPHTPIVPTPEWQGKSGINPYADFTMQVDAVVGQVLEALEKHGLSDNTLVVFTADNGCSPAANIQELQAAGHQPSHIYRGHKADLFEGGHRVPFLVRWPARVKAGTRSDRLIGQWDLIATCADLFDAELPPGAGEDSVSFLPALLGDDTAPGREHLISQSINGSFAIRQGTWKLLLCPGSGGWSDPKPGSPQHADLPPVQLYDLATDPGETRNLAAEQPERVAAMRQLIETLIARGRSTPGPDLTNDVPVQLIKPAPPAKGKAKAKSKGA